MKPLLLIFPLFLLSCTQLQQADLFGKANTPAQEFYAAVGTYVSLGGIIIPYMQSGKADLYVKKDIQELSADIQQAIDLGKQAYDAGQTGAVVVYTAMIRNLTQELIKILEEKVVVK